MNIKELRPIRNTRFIKAYNIISIFLLMCLCVIKVSWQAL